MFFYLSPPGYLIYPGATKEKRHTVHINIPQLPRMQLHYSQNLAVLYILPSQSGDQTGDPHDFLLQLPCKKCVGIRFINKYKEHVVFNVFVLVFMNHGIVLMKSPVKNVNYKEWGTRNISQY